MRIHFGRWLCLFMFFLGKNVLAMESTTVLPKGVRNVSLRTVDTNLSQKTDGDGQAKPLSEPLSKEIKFSNVIKGEASPLKRAQVKTFLELNGYNEDQVVGQFSADLSGHIRVFAPILAYGITDRLTLAIAAPIYAAQTKVKVGFRPSETGQKFIDDLAKPENNLTANAYEAADKINRAVDKLSEKLDTNGYKQLDDWRGTGPGDMTIAAKYAAYTDKVLRTSVTSGVVAPTGRVDDPDILNDVGFGDGQWDIFAQATADQYAFARDDLFLNEFFKYTYQMPGKKRLRQTTDDEPIEVPVVDANAKFGDKYETGVSLQYQPAFGLLSGLGYTYQRKFGDRLTYNGERLGNPENGTDQSAHFLEFLVGYSTIPSFRRGTFAAPMELKGSYSRQLQSRNLPVGHLYQLEAAVYF